MAFCVIRHPGVAVAGTCVDEALPIYQARGWYRVSEYGAEPAAFDVSAYGPDLPDLDASPPAPTGTVRKSTSGKDTAA